MPLVSATQLAQLRSVAYEGLDTEITIERPVQVESDFGSTESFELVGTAMAWIREMSSSAPGNQIKIISTTEVFRIHVRHDVDLQPQDRITAGTTQFTVTGVNTDNTIRIYTTAIARRVE